ncbi:MAG: hypothetical protein U0975_08980, partial [Erythrobacter sp.]|nr:hypothetical protein [Erythrobacter sp.]
MVNFPPRMTSCAGHENASGYPKVTEGVSREAPRPALATTWWEWPRAGIVHLYGGKYERLCNAADSHHS